MENKAQDATDLLQKPASKPASISPIQPTTWLHEKDQQQGVPSVVSNKTRATKIVIQQNGKQPGPDNPKPEIEFTHFLSHVPKSGAVYAFQTLNKLLWNLPEWNEDRIKNGGHGIRGCNQAKANPIRYQNYVYSYKGSKCTLWMSEHGYTTLPQHIYTILREPREHVLSMYFHCKQSKDHDDRADHMPSLDEWLQAWADAKNNETLVRENRKFACYNPINYQAKFTKYDPLEGKDDLKQKYDVIGDNAQMPKTVCTIFIRYTGWVPKECDCTSLAPKRRRKMVAVHNRTLPVEHQVLRKLRLEYDTSQHSHGVKNHGKTYKTTPYQDELIAKLRDVDKEVYRLGREVFQEQVKEVEEEYKIHICDDFRE